MLEYLLPIIEGTEHTCFCELFGGAGWVMHAKKPSKSDIYNDGDCDLVNFFEVVKYKKDELIESLKNELSSRYLFEKYKKEFDRLRSEGELNIPDVHRAKLFYYLNQASNHGVGETFGVDTNGKTCFNLDTIPGRIETTHKVFSRVHIECLDYRDIFRKYNKPHTLMFADPPYYHKERRYRFNTFTKEEDFIELRDVFQSIKGKVIITLNDHPFIHNLFKDFEIQKVPVRKRQELIIKNF